MIAVGARLDPLLRLLLRLRDLVRRPRAARSGVLLVSSRGPAEMVFLSAVLPRFMRLGGRGEPVTLLCRPDAAGMAFLFPRHLHVLKVDFRHLERPVRRWAVFARVRDARFRLAVSLDHTHEAAAGEALVGATGAPGTAAMRGAARPDGPVRRLVDVGPPRQDKILRWSRYADELLDDRQPPQLAMVTEARLPTPIRMPPTLVIMPFSGVRARQLPPAFWRRVAESVPQGWQVRVAGHGDDFRRNPEFNVLLQLPHVMQETHDFERLAAVLRGARMVVGVDTAGVHLAVLLGVPTLCLASAAYVGAGVPYDDRVLPAHVRFFHTPMDCQGCLGRCRLPPERGMLPCVARLDPDDVAMAVQDAVARGGV